MHYRVQKLEAYLINENNSQILHRDGGRVGIAREFEIDYIYGTRWNYARADAQHAAYGNLVRTWLPLKKYAHFESV